MSSWKEQDVLLKATGRTIRKLERKIKKLETDVEKLRGFIFWLNDREEPVHEQYEIDQYSNRLLKETEMK